MKTFRDLQVIAYFFPLDEVSDLIGQAGICAGDSIEDENELASKVPA